MIPFTPQMIAEAEQASTYPPLPPALAEQMPGVLQAATDAFWESIGEVMRDHGISGDDLGWSGFDQWPPAVTRWVIELLAGNMPQFTIGTRVRLVRDVDRYPHFLARKGMTGTVSDVTSGNISVKMDKHLPGAEEWDNEIVWSADHGESPHEDIEAVTRCTVILDVPADNVSTAHEADAARLNEVGVGLVEWHDEDMLERGEH